MIGPWIRLPRNFVPTHETGGLPGYPAIDVFAKPGTLIFPPERGTLVNRHFIQWSESARVGGLTVYLHGASGAIYFLTHFWTMRDRPRIQLWHPLGRVAAVPHNAWAPHIHEGKHVATALLGEIGGAK